MNRPPYPLLHQLADAAGLLATWRDVHGRERRVGTETLRRVLTALDLPCDSESQCHDSLARLGEDGAEPISPSLLIVPQGSPVIVRRSGSPHYRLELEDGTRLMGTARDLDGNHVAIPGVRRPGYHRLLMGRIETRVAVVPPRSHTLHALTGQDRPWIVGAQVYSLHRRREGQPASLEGGAARLPGWEIGGDFRVVGELAQGLARHGAAGLAISPVHAMFSADPGRYSPYAPSSRLFLNAAYADPGTVFEADMLRPLLRNTASFEVSADDCMDWPSIQRHRLVQLRRVYEAFIQIEPQGPAADFAAFLTEGGEALAGHARFEALHAHHVSQLGPAHGWADWPADYRDPHSVAVRTFAQEHAHEVRFHAFLQWLAARSLAAAHAGAKEAGMPLGLIADMAVGTDPRGSHAWTRQTQIMTGVSVGAPPDLFQPAGQSWGLTAFSPRALRLRGYEGFIETLRAVLAHAGGVRVDHVLGLQRMWLVPEGEPPSEGVYLRYPRDDLLDLLTLEAWRHRAVAVGENLGTVPDDFNEAIERRGILGMNVLWFEQDGKETPVFRYREQWPSQAMATISTHDLPTLRGWWAGRDIEWRGRLGGLRSDEIAEAQTDRERQREALWLALQQAGLVTAGAPVPAEAPVAEVLDFVAGTPAVLFNVSLEDLVGQTDQPNLPSSGESAAAEGHPNWSRLLALAVEDLLENEGVGGLLERVERIRSGAAERKGGVR